MRCRKAHWFLSALCDDTLSEKQRRDLTAHLEECPSCRREAFYFSEIKGQTGRLEKIRTRTDFNLRLRAKINAWEAEQEEIRQAGPSIWAVLAELPSRLGSWVVDAGGILVGQRRFALVGVLSVFLAVMIWNGYRSNSALVSDEGTLSQEIAETPLSELPEGGGVYLVGIPESAGQDQNYLVSAISLNDEISPRTQPNYVMPTISVEQVSERAIF